MIPLLAIVRIRHARGRLSLWAPVGLLWPPMALVALVLAPFWAALAMVRGRNPLALAGGVCGLILSLRGVQVDVESPAASVLVRLI